MIELKNISKSFKNQDLFEDCSFTFENGKKYLIIGDNGVGKSVLLKIIVGYSLIDKGEVVINSEKLGGKFDFLPDAGVSINAPQFSNYLTGLENLIEIAKIKKKATKSIIINLAKTLELELDKKYNTYSLGMRQKMRIIQALMESPSTLILDEPFDGLDSKMKEVTKTLINNFLKERDDRIVIFTSHDSQSLEFADVVLKIEDYKIKELE